MDSSFQQHYASISDEELLHITANPRDLREHAASALDAEMARRSLTLQHARAKKKHELTIDIQEARAHGPKRIKSKYLVG